MVSVASYPVFLSVANALVNASAGDTGVEFVVAVVPQAARPRPVARRTVTMAKRLVFTEGLL
jgi:hypothetical protein